MDFLCFRNLCNFDVKFLLSYEIVIDFVVNVIDVVYVVVYVMYNILICKLLNKCFNIICLIILEMFFDFVLNVDF